MLVRSKSERFLNKRESRWSDFCPVTTVIGRDCRLMPVELSWEEGDGGWGGRAVWSLNSLSCFCFAPKKCNNISQSSGLGL